MRWLLFILGGCAGIWLATQWWFNPFERVLWRLFWDHIGDYGHHPAPRLLEILSSPLFRKCLLAFCGGGMLITLFVRRR